MGYRTFVSLNIAIIGDGKKVVSLAKRLMHAGHHANIGWKDTGLTNKNNITEDVSFMSIEDAAAGADVIIIKSATADVREIAYLLDDVRHKVIVDATFVLSDILDENINTTKAISAITGSPYVIKSFSCAGLQHVIEPLFKGLRIDSFVAGNSKKAKEVFKLLAASMGYGHCYDFGDDSTISLLEEMSKCWYSLSLREQVARKPAEVVVKK